MKELFDYKVHTDPAMARKQADAYRTVFGYNASTVWHDEVQHWAKYPEACLVDVFVDGDEWCWAVAFRHVVKCGPQFYESASDARRRQLEKHYAELAAHDTRKGRRAQQVVAIFMELKLSRSAP